MRINISMIGEVQAKAEKVIAARKVGGLSRTLAVLIDEEYNRKVASGEIKINDQLQETANPPPMPPAEEVSYTKPVILKVSELKKNIRQIDKTVAELKKLNAKPKKKRKGGDDGGSKKATAG